MLDTNHLPPNMFVLEGPFLGYLNPKKKKAKAIVVEVEQEQCVIKLPKEVRASLKGHRLQPGERIRCIGRSQVDFETGIIKLRAYQVFRLPPFTEDKQFTAPSAAPAMASPLSSADLSVCTQRKQAKILVCRKSGCQKRGGRRLVAALEQLLQNHQLQEQVEIQYTGCQKRCSKSPTMTIMPGKHRYDRLNLQSLPNLVEKHFCTSKSHQADYENQIPPIADQAVDLVYR